MRKIKYLLQAVKIMLLAAIAVVLLLVCGIFDFHTSYVFADAETLEEKIERFTSSDTLVGENYEPENEYVNSINEFADKIKSDEYRPVGATSGYEITERIGKVIPLELFYTEGIHVYMGEEYGFIVISTKNTEVGFFNDFLLIDFEFESKLANTDSSMTGETGERLPNKFVYRMEPILNQYCQTNSNPETGKWEVWLPDTSPGDNIVLNDIGFNVSLRNENEPNAFDEYYNKENDNGDIITRVGMDYKAVSSRQYDVDWETLADFAVDYVVTPTLQVMDEWAVPGAGIAKKIIGYTRSGLSFFESIDAIDDVVEQKVEYQESTGNADKIEWNSKRREDQEEDKAFTREVYFRQSESTLNSCYFLPSLNFGEKNCFVEFDIDTDGIQSNSRMEFSICFQAIFSGLSDYYIVQTEDGNYELQYFDPINEDLRESKPISITHSVSRKIRLGDVSDLTDFGSPAYLLDNTGYQIYKFQPKSEGEVIDQFVFGDYCFYTIPVMGVQPGTRIHLFKSNGTNGELDLDELCLMSREELLEHPYLLAHNNDDSPGDMWELNYTFTYDSSTNNLYYILYTYSFDYLGGSSYFEAAYDFVPPELELDGTDEPVYLGIDKESYFMFNPSHTGNYTIQTQGIQNTTLCLYETQVGSTKIKETYKAPSLDALLRAGKTYYIRVMTSQSNVSGTINVVPGEEIEGYQIEFSNLGSLEVKYYKFIPCDFSGNYDIETDGTEITWYNSSFEPLDYNSNGNVFLTKNNIYYLKVGNDGVIARSGEIIINYLYENTFNSSLQVFTEGHQQYYAYVIEGVNVQGLSLEIIVDFNGSNIYSDTIIATDNTIVIPADLTDVHFIQGKNTINASIIVNGNMQNPAQIPKQEINVIGYQLNSASFSNEYVYLNCKSQSFSFKIITIPDSVEILIINSTSTVTLSGICFKIEASAKPLIIHFNSAYNFTINAPLNQSLISSERDIIFNCKGTITLRGGNGMDNENSRSLDGDPAINAWYNTVVFNGSGTLRLYGGNGGDTYGQEFYSIDVAGDGGTAIEVDNLVINVYSIYIKGGAGGNGGVGIRGTDGIDGTSSGADGTDGGNGGYGGDGGSAGMGIWVLGDYCAVYTSSIRVYGGTAGNGGTGGRGGDGGNGADGSRFGDGGDGGDSGSGGMGGDYGTGMIAFNQYDTRKIVYYNTSGIAVSLPNNLLNMFEAWSADGTPGDGGDPGTPGTGGKGGSGVIGIGGGDDGQNGILGRKGSSGGNPNPHVSLTNTYSIIMVQNKYETVVNSISLDRYIIRRLGKETAYALYGINL